MQLTGEASAGLARSEIAIKAAEAESGNLYVAGEAPAGTLVRVFANDELVGEARAGNEGAWLLEAKKDVPVGEVTFRVEAAPESASGVGVTAEASAPFMRYPDGIVLEPVVEAQAGRSQVVSGDAIIPRPAYVIIRRGDNLWRIARRNYGRGIKYEAIFAANRDSINNPHWIFPGQVFVIPTRDRSWEAAVN
jgi:nucleoid-associated protein YgaU